MLGKNKSRLTSSSIAANLPGNPRVANGSDLYPATERKSGARSNSDSEEQKLRSKVQEVLKSTALAVIPVKSVDPSNPTARASKRERSGERREDNASHGSYRLLTWDGAALSPVSGKDSVGQSAFSCLSALASLSGAELGGCFFQSFFQVT